MQSALDENFTYFRDPGIAGAEYIPNQAAARRAERELTPEQIDEYYRRAGAAESRLSPLREETMETPPQAGTSPPPPTPPDLELQRAQAYRGGPAAPGSDVGLGTALGDPRSGTRTRIGMDARRPRPGQPDEIVAGAPVTEPNRPSGALIDLLKAKQPAEAPMTSGGEFTGGSPGRDLEGQRALATSSSTASATMGNVPGGVLKTEAPTPAPGAEPIRPRGASPRKAAINDRDEFQDVTPKARIDPRYLQRLEQSNPALHDSIVAAATKAGIGSWEYANLIYSASKGDPNYRDKDGRMGIAGLTQEDITRFQQEYPDLFRDQQGNPVNAMDPATQLILGAQKYRETRDYYGAGTPDSIVSYYLGVGRTNQLATLTPEQQREHLPADVLKRTQVAIGGPDAETGEAKALRLNGGGTLTAPQIMQAATQAARSGDTRPFVATMAQGLPKGMSSGDGWRHVEALAVRAMMARGNYEGAQRAREMIFQMSHVGAVQGLMRARQLMGEDGKGDLVGAAQALAQAYYNVPDGGLGKFYVTNQGLMGQRFNESTGQKVGGMFAVTPQFLDGLLNQALDPQTFLKSTRESQKLNADIVKSNAEAAHKIAEIGTIPSKIALQEAQTKTQEAQADYYRERPGLEQMRSENILTAKIAEIWRKADKEGGLDPKAEAALRSHIDSLAKEYWPAFQELTEDESRQQRSFGDIMFHNRHVQGGTAKQIAAGIANGMYTPAPVTEGRYKGYGVLQDKNKKNIGVVLSPGHMQLLGKASTRYTGDA